MAAGHKTGGRVKGTLNKSTRDIKAMAQKHGKAAIDGLVELMGHDEPDIRLRAAQAVLDRGFGKPAQAHTGEGGEGPVRVEVVTGIADHQG